MGLDFSEMSDADLEALQKQLAERKAAKQRLLDEVRKAINDNRQAEKNAVSALAASIRGLWADFDAKAKAERDAFESNEIKPLLDESATLKAKYEAERTTLIADAEAKGVPVPDNVKSGFAVMNTFERKQAASNAPKRPYYRFEPERLTDAKRAEAIELLSQHTTMLAADFNRYLDLSGKEGRALTEHPSIAHRIQRIGHDRGATITLIG